MNKQHKVLYRKGQAPRHTRRAMHAIDHPNSRHEVDDAYIKAGHHLERHVHATQNLDNPPVPRPMYVTRTDGSHVRYYGP